MALLEIKMYSFFQMSDHRFENVQVTSKRMYTLGRTDSQLPPSSPQRTEHTRSPSPLHGVRLESIIDVMLAPLLPTWKVITQDWMQFWIQNNRGGERVDFSLPSYSILQQEQKLTKLQQLPDNSSRLLVYLHLPSEPEVTITWLSI